MRNHTTMLADAFVPNFLVFKKKNYIIVSQETSSIPFVKGIVRSFGALPLPDNINLKKKFFKAIKDCTKRYSFITIYP